MDWVSHDRFDHDPCWASVMMLLWSKLWSVLLCYMLVLYVLTVYKTLMLLVCIFLDSFCQFFLICKTNASHRAFGIFAWLSEALTNNVFTTDSSTGISFKN